MTKAQRLTQDLEAKPEAVNFGVFATGDPRIDEDSRKRAANIVGMVAEVVAKGVRMPDGRPVECVWRRAKSQSRHGRPRRSGKAE